MTGSDKLIQAVTSSVLVDVFSKHSAPKRSKCGQRPHLLVIIIIYKQVRYVRKLID